MIDLTTFALAGNATFTVVSKKTGKRFTFRVRQPKDDSPHFVSLMNGPDNEGSYCFLGTIFNGRDYRHGRRSRIIEDAPSAKAFKWIWNHRNDPDFTDKVEYHHEGRCGCCGKKLTVPESIELGLGPWCAERMGL